MVQNKYAWFWKYMVSPVGKAKFSHENDNLLFFLENENAPYQLANGKTPILIEGGLFDVDSISKKEITTQNPSYGDTSILKNYIRRHILPKLSNDTQINKRYDRLISYFKGKEIKVLVIGAGQKSNYYKEIFGKYTLTSDIHLQYGVDLVLDAHFIPFENETFDLVLAQQVLEHCMRPWEVSSEIQRVVKKDGYIQIEVPFCFPYHSAPYDFYRYTYSGIRSLFRNCKVEKIMVPEGTFSAIAISISTALIESSNKRVFRILLLTVARILLWPFKYSDFLISRKLKNRMSMPKGFAITFLKDGIYREDSVLISEIKVEMEMDLSLTES